MPGQCSIHGSYINYFRLEFIYTLVSRHLTSPLTFWPLLVTRAIIPNLQSASSWTIKSILSFPESSVELQQNKGGVIWKSFDFHIDTVAADLISLLVTHAWLPALFIPCSLVDLFLPSNVFCGCGIQAAGQRVCCSRV